MAEEEPEVDLLTETDLYKILGVPRGAKLDDIKKAYKKRSLRFHPDKNLGDPEAKPKFQKIAEAFSVLSDEKKRLRYDKSGDMDLEDFDMDQFMNVWVGEMMEEGGIVDDMMQEVLPWANDDEKLAQFMDEKVKSQGKKLVCTICGHTASNKRLMLAHFEQKHLQDCEDWARETIKSMKASFESFMKQVTGIGDASGTFVLPDGTTADMSKVKGVPDIRSHMQKKVDKAKEADAVLEMYRKLTAQAEAAGPATGGAAPASGADVQPLPGYNPDAKEIATVLGVTAQEAESLRCDRDELLRRLRERIDRINEEDDEEAAAMEQMQGLFGGDLGDLGDLDLDELAALTGLGGPGMGLGASMGKAGAGKGGKKGRKGAGGDLGGLFGGLPPGMGMGMPGAGLPPGMEELLGSGMGLGMPGMGMPPGMEELLASGDLEQLLGGLPPELLAGMGGAAPSRAGGRGPSGPGRPPAREEQGPSKEIGCSCGYSCGTMKALEKHLDRFRGDPSHEARITERPASPPRPQPGPEEVLLPPELAARLGGLRQGASGSGSFREAAPAASVGELACKCGYTCGTAKALQRHLDKFAGNPAHKRK